MSSSTNQESLVPDPSANRPPRDGPTGLRPAATTPGRERRGTEMMRLTERSPLYEAAGVVKAAERGEEVEKEVLRNGDRRRTAAGPPPPRRGRHRQRPAQMIRLGREAPLGAPRKRGAASAPSAASRASPPRSPTGRGSAVEANVRPSLPLVFRGKATWRRRPDYGAGRHRVPSRLRRVHWQHCAKREARSPVGPAAPTKDGTLTLMERPASLPCPAPPCCSFVPGGYTAPSIVSRLGQSFLPPTHAFFFFQSKHSRNCLPA